MSEVLPNNQTTCHRPLHHFTSPWPFVQWGLDIVGPFPKSEHKKYLLVDTYYITKWVKAEPLRRIRDQDVKSFLWKNNITRFGIPRTLIMENGTQFKSLDIRDLCDKYGIIRSFSSLGFPKEMDKQRHQTKLY